MKKLFLVRAAGLTPDDACRGDVAANLSDLIADGSFAPLSAPPDLEAAARSLGADRVSLVDLPYRDMPSFDEALAGILAGADGAEVAVISDSVFISRRCFPEIKPGAVLPPREVARLLGAMAAG